MQSVIITVSQLCRYVKALLEEKPTLKDVMVKGELSNLSYRSASGHLYFSLKEGESLIRCVMFSRYSSGLSRWPEEGSMVLVRGEATLYARDGSFQLIVYEMQELGSVGKKKDSLEQLTEKLRREGLFAPERKKPIPRRPKAVAVITSPDGAAVHDIMTTFARRNPLVKLCIYPAVMQGEEAPASILYALRQAARDGECQSCVIARGGGSQEDLSAFNDEMLVRGAAAFPLPLVSAVGHEVDYTLLDFVADERAATPTAACERMTCPLDDVKAELAQKRERIQQLTGQLLRARRERLEQLSLRLSAGSPQKELNRNRQKLAFLVQLMEKTEKEKLSALKAGLTSRMERLELVNPMSCLKRGYSISRKDGKVVSGVDGLSRGDILTTIVADGIIQSEVITVERKDGNGGEEGAQH